MNTARKTLLMVVRSVAAIGALAAAGGCGGAKPDSTEPLEAARNPQNHATRRGEPGRAAREGEGEGDGDAMPAMPPELQRFHAVLAPRWHRSPGPERVADTCGAIGELHAGADAVVAAPPPAGRDAAAWSAGGTQLAEAVAALDATCQAHDAAGFEPAFAQVHARFHGLLEPGEPRHDEH